LTDRYFQSRPVSDMGERCHNVQMLRQGPELAAGFLRNVFGVAFTVAAIGWPYPESLWAAAVVAAIGVPLAAQPVLAERDLKLRSHSGALTRYYLDALLGRTAIRAHAAEPAVQGEQAALLGRWARAGFALQRAVVATDGAQFTLSLLVAVGLVWTRLAHGGDAGSMLLLIYWVLNLPVMGEEAAQAVWQFPLQRNTALRLLEPLGAPKAETGCAARAEPRRSAPHIRLDEVTVRAAGITILEKVSLEIPAGTHVAIVGPSGAGKSSLVGLLLGWHRATAGAVTVDGEPIDVEALRAHTAWVDPQVQLWNRSLFDNLCYGGGDAAAIEEALDGAELRGVLHKLPDGLQTPLGEGGTLVSGGEGQRVRLGRAMMRREVRLAIPDEPARGLDCERRRAAIERARERWWDATLLCITHDVADTEAFERVLVIARRNRRGRAPSGAGGAAGFAIPGAARCGRGLRVLKLIRKWLKAGVMEDGTVRETLAGFVFLGCTIRKKSSILRGTRGGTSCTTGRGPRNTSSPVRPSMCTASDLSQGSSRRVSRAPVRRLKLTSQESATTGR
jgi:ABC-type transport system involved in cytochrome bd biosynthesis fused ATPase/permease subunit